MTTSTREELRSKHCRPCEGGTPPLTYEEAQHHLEELDGWDLTDGGASIRREWELENFAAGMAFLVRVAGIAEREQHHPELHLTNYRHVAIELTTHAIGGLSENDFIVAAKIDEVPVKLKK
jgi:4a-hydroxytetrahydrobiopterin dehydratase